MTDDWPKELLRRIYRQGYWTPGVERPAARTGSVELTQHRFDEIVDGWKVCRECGLRWREQQKGGEG